MEGVILDTISPFLSQGILKPFRYTEIQKHTFHLKSKDDSKDRQVPAMPLAYYNRQGQLTR